MHSATATARIDSPIGVIALTATNAALTGVRILPKQRGAMLVEGHPVLSRAVEQMERYFAGTLSLFDVPLAPTDSEEGKSLRAAIAAIPYGQTRTYGALASEAGSAARAVGQACKTNPFPIIIPCHRVVSTSGPEYYSGGDGPRTKTWLNDFEYNHLPPAQRTRLI